MTDDKAATTEAASALPFVAPCRSVSTWAPLGWLRKGWADFVAAPRQSLTFGALVVLLSWSLAYITYQRHARLIFGDAATRESRGPGS